MKYNMGNITSTLDYINEHTEDHDENYLKNLLNTSVEELIYPVKWNSYDIACPKSFHLEYTDSADKISYVIIKSPSIPSDKYIIWSHSSRSNLMSEYYYLTMVALENNVNIIIYDYIGYGNTQPDTSPSEEGCYYSLKMLIEHCRYKKNIPKGKIFLVGDELGCAVTIKYASITGWTGPIMLISPFKSVGDLVIHHIHDYIIKNNYDGDVIKNHISYFNIYRKLDDIKCPIKIIHNSNNQLVPISDVLSIYTKYSAVASKNMIRPLSPTILDCITIRYMLTENIMNDILNYQIRVDDINFMNYQRVLDDL
jgi:hypothetical protein